MSATHEKQGEKNIFKKWIVTRSVKQSNYQLK